MAKCWHNCSRDDKPFLDQIFVPSYRRLSKANIVTLVKKKWIRNVYEPNMWGVEKTVIIVFQ